MFSPLITVLFLLGLAGSPVEIGEVAQRIETPQGCTTGVAFDGTRLWIADRRSDRIYALDPATGNVLANLEAPCFWPTGLAFDGEQLWVADRNRKLGLRFDTDTGIVTRTIELDLDQPEGLAWDGTHLWCVDGRKDRIVKLDPEDGTAILFHPAPSSNPTGLCFDGSFLWVADRIDDAIYRVNPETGRAIMKLPAPGPYPYGLASLPNGLVCADYQNDTLDRISLEGERKALITEGRRARVSLVLELINFGPGQVATADFYVAVPSNGDNQTLLSEVAFEPAPLEIVEDKWGQPIAHFRFEEIENADRARAIMRCDVAMNDVLYLLIPEKVGSLDEIPQEIKAKYLADGSKYDLANDYIVNAVKTIVGDEKNVLRNVLKIYDYVIDHVEYEMVGGWNTAAHVLKRGTGSCSEYTFCFIACCRAAGIPARYAGSLVVRGDEASFDDVFHRWAEVYLPNYGWIPFDPSRGDKPKPADQLKGIGWVADTLFITTRGGGGSEYLGWTYNAETKWTTRGRCRVETEQIAEWEPLE
ncbi:MAG: transglutaminase [Planctomycetes bacterium]|nr:transglutaminase [Planctomycetota bacterium]